MTKTILVIEDDASIAEVISIILQGEGYSVLVDNTGQKILKQKIKIPVDLILVDYLLPGTTGVEIIKSIQSQKLLQNTPVIMMSANTETELAELAASCGIDTYIAKPFDVEHLIQTVQKKLSD